MVLLSLPGPDLSLATSELREAGVAAHAVVADVRDFGSVQQAVSQIARDLGRIDVLVTSAGIADQSSITGGSPERWQQVVQTNLLGTANSIRAVAPLMTQAGAGDIVVIASALGAGHLRGRAAVHRQQVGRGRARSRGPQGTAGSATSGSP